LKLFWVIIGGLALVIVSWLLIVVVGGGLVARSQQWLLRRKARQALGATSAEGLLRDIDRDIAALEQKAAAAKAEAGKLAGRFGVMGHTEGPYSQIRSLRKYRRAIVDVSDFDLPPTEQ